MPLCALECKGYCLEFGTLKCYLFALPATLTNNSYRVHYREQASFYVQRYFEYLLQSFLDTFYSPSTQLPFPKISPSTTNTTFYSTP